MLIRTSYERPAPHVSAWQQPPRSTAGAIPTAIQSSARHAHRVELEAQARAAGAGLPVLHRAPRARRPPRLLCHPTPEGNLRGRLAAPSRAMAAAEGGRGVATGRDLWFSCLILILGMEGTRARGRAGCWYGRLLHIQRRRWGRPAQGLRGRSCPRLPGTRYPSEPSSRENR